MPVNPLPEHKCERITKMIPVVVIFAMAASAICLPAVMTLMALS